MMAFIRKLLFCLFFIALGAFCYWLYYNSFTKEAEVQGWRVVPHPYHFGNYPRKIFVHKQMPSWWKTEIIESIHYLNDQLERQTKIKNWVVFGGFFREEDDLPDKPSTIVVYSGTLLMIRRDKRAKQNCRIYGEYGSEKVMAYIHLRKNKNTRIVLCDEKIDDFLSQFGESSSIRQIGAKIFTMHEIGHTIWGGNHTYSERGLMNPYPSSAKISSVEIEIIKKHVLPLRMTKGVILR